MQQQFITVEDNMKLTDQESRLILVKARISELIIKHSRCKSPKPNLLLAIVKNICSSSDISSEEQEKLEDIVRLKYNIRKGQEVAD